MVSKLGFIFKINFLNVSILLNLQMIGRIQHILEILIVLGFAIGLYPGMYYEVFPYLLFIILLQIVICLFRFKAVSLFLEFFILLLALLSLIPYLGFIFRLFGFLISLFNMNGYNVDFSKVKRNFGTFRVYKKSNDKIHNEEMRAERSSVRGRRKTVNEYKDAEFSQRDIKKDKYDTDF